jgi:hypothetical protein
LLAGLGLAALTAAPAWGQSPPHHYPGGCPPLPHVTPPPYPGKPYPPAPVPVPPGTPVTGPTAFDIGTPVATAGGAYAGRTASNNGGAYLDNPVPANQLRLRFDAAYNNRRPDRAEFFYPKCGCFRTAGLDPDADGPPLLERSVDYQEISTYAEALLLPQLSVFFEVPVRFINPDINDNTAGLSDLNTGVKYAFLASDCFVASAQFRVYIPTGDGDRGLGTEHVSLEPALLVYQRLGESLHFQAEIRDWIPIDGSDFAGNVLRYGAGLTYYAIDTETFRFGPVAELVGWTVLDGHETVVHSVETQSFTVEDSEGATIINSKIGVRLGIGSPEAYGMGPVDLYFGWGRALTGDNWYEDIYRFELRFFF